MDEKVKEIEKDLDEGLNPTRGQVEYLISKVKELEESNEGLRDALNLRKGALTQATNGIKQLNERIDEFVDGIERYLGDPEFDTSILTKLIEKEKKDG